MWLHVLDYNNQKLIAIRIGEVPEKQEDSEHSTKSEEFHYNSICEKLGHTNFDWVEAETRNFEAIDLRPKKKPARISVVSLAIGNKSDDCDVSTDKFRVPLNATYLKMFRAHQDYIILNSGVSMIRLPFPIDLDDSDFRIGTSHVDIFKDGVYFGAVRKSNCDSYFESEELTIDSLEKLFEDAQK